MKRALTASPRLDLALPEAAAAISHLSDLTVTRYQREWVLFASGHKGATVESITPKVIAAWVARLIKVGLKASSIGAKAVAVTALFDALIRIEVRRAANPCTGAALPKVPIRIKDTISPEQFRALVAAAATPRQRAILLLLGHGGLRGHELELLRCDHFSKDGRSIRFIGKGDKEREVRLSPSVVEAVREVWPWQSVSVFDARHAIAVAKKGAGITENITRHNLRRCAARLMREAGAEDGAIAKQLGNTVPTLSARYLAPDDSTRASAVERMG